MIKTEGLTYQYGHGTPFEKTAVNNISVDIKKGEFVGIIGHTGSGKSTFVQHLNGLLKPDSGKVYIDGKDIWEKPKEIRKYRFKAGLVFQYPEYQLFEETCYKDIAFGPKNMGLDERETDRRVRRAAQIVELKEELLEKSPFDISGGEKRRVAIAGVLSMRPEILILDEPTAGLDPKGRDRILGQILEYRQETGATVLLVSHSMENIARISDRVLVMNCGSMKMFGTVDEVFSRADELNAIGLELPEITKIFHRLHERGLGVSPNIYTVEDGEKEILRVLKQEDIGRS